MNISEINFTNPFVIRRWLRMLKSDAEIGYLLNPNIYFSKRELGFSIDSNVLGLRGPSDLNAENVIIGTSFAMGFGVDRGKNWYELGLDYGKWFNAGLPVGPNEWNCILNRFYTGNYEHALFIYHPNILKHGVSFIKWRESGRDIFNFLGWRTSLKDCVRIKLRNFIRDFVKKRSGKILSIKKAGKDYRINSTYSLLDRSDYIFVDRVHDEMLQLLSRFKHVTVVRVRIKEEEVPIQAQSFVLERTIEQYDDIWVMTRNVLNGHNSIEIHEAPLIGMESYNQYDTHWNATGNARFSTYVNKVLDDRQY